MKLMHLIRTIVLTGAVASLAGCAHDITISGDPAAFTTSTKSAATSTDNATPINKTVGLVITDDLRTKEVVTPGGGGDKVAYKPYRDLELPIYVELGQVFKNVVKLNTTPDQATSLSKNLNYVVTPTISTTSSSPSLLTWPPTDFSVTLVCTVTDPDGKLVTKKEVTGSGHAEFSEFKRNFGLAAQRATLDAVQKMQAAMQDSPELRQ
ncbi:hypothetical protein [Paraburkholderia saeva]|uniref:hypothetical protein n=1 Tax=Paraburkholderia saeva TaxID=2777537 RepID=UPI001D6EC760|nr:hypothetical protein [Paraburkholderia saeva]CAG4892605.1 hypothetical protein R52603_01456 [Paraburkholderia saeva]CAG4921000.1 hypothetical protein R70241_04911 [Paraburkholderia saeva]